MKRLLIAVVLVWVSSSLYAENYDCYTPQGTVKDRLGEGIEYAQQGIDICIRNFAALDIAKELVVARDKGIRVRVIILEYSGKERGPLAETLMQKGFDIRILNASISDADVQEFILLDDRVLVTGVYNWLAYQNRNIRNEVLFYYDLDRIRACKEKFYTLFAEGEPIPFLDNRKEWTATTDPTVSATPSHITDARRNSQDIIFDKSPETTEKSSGAVLDVQSKDFMDISFDELDKQFGKESLLSRSEKNELWKKYKGKYVRWQGIVIYKGMGRVDWNHIGVSRYDGRGAEVEIIFDWRMFEKVMDVNVGKKITYSGKLVSRPIVNAPYRLDDGNIE
ncbi:hypothetical protein BAC3_00742 [uncultured bacterium]|nr:hypothetical protein BAC3_00742 [uncultured bacterium]